MRKGVLIIFIFSVMVKAAIGITCFECDSMHDPHCHEYLTAESKEANHVECQNTKVTDITMTIGRVLPATGCIVKFYEGVDGNRFFIRRGCFYGDIDKDKKDVCAIEDPYLPYADLISCRICDEDLCNTSIGSKFISPVIVNLLILFLGLRIFQ